MPTVIFADEVTINALHQLFDSDIHHHRVLDGTPDLELWQWTMSREEDVVESMCRLPGICVGLVSQSVLDTDTIRGSEQFDVGFVLKVVHVRSAYHVEFFTVVLQRIVSVERFPKALFDVATVAAKYAWVVSPLLGHFSFCGKTCGSNKNRS